MNNIESPAKTKSEFLPFANLPTVLQKGVDAFEMYHEKMMFLYGAITALSSLGYKISGEYRRQTIHPHTYLFILAPAGYGKSALNHAINLLNKVHNTITDESLKQLNEYKAQLVKLKKSSTPISLEKPPLRVVKIPVNSSSAKLTEHLAANAGVCPSIMADSEIDTLVIASQSEWGNFSDTLRKAYHNEPITYSRKMNDEFIEVRFPMIAIALAGTFNQFRKLITNAEDGLYSRFLVYSFNDLPKWSDVAPCLECVNLNDHFATLSNTVYQYYEYFKEKNITISLTEEQWAQINQFGEDNLFDALEKGNTNCVSIVNRHSLMIYKICMTLTALRMAEVNSTDTAQICNDTDFELALWLSQQSLNNSLALLHTLPGVKATGPKFSREKLLENLPMEFDRATAIEIGTRLTYSERTIGRILDESLENGSLLKAGHGKYKKP